jgi:succinyldiaminopimelate transaminase
LLGAGPGDVVAFPTLAYPTYDVGARLAGASPRPTDSLTGLGPVTAATKPKLLWVNSPSNPTGQVLGTEHLAKVVRWARQHGVIVASDECYAELDWRPEAMAMGADLAPAGSVPSILDPQVCDGSHEGLLAVYSLSKQSNMAGYRAAFVAGDRALVGRLLELRKHAGMMVPWPVQMAMVAALSDDAHVAQQRVRYGIRREQLKTALEEAGYRIEHSEAGLYLWATRDGGVNDGRRADDDDAPGAVAGDSWALVSELAERGILVAPGSFYGVAGERHIRVSLTATDERIDAAASRLSSHGQNR